MKNALAALLAIAIPVAVLFLIEGILAIAGYSKTAPSPYAHPPHYTEQRSSIEFEYTFTTNAHGLRYRDIADSPARDEYRLLMVGDSFTEGYGVDASETFGANLEDRFAERRGTTSTFINGGLSGAGPLQYRRMFAFAGRAYDVDGLLVCVYANDVSDSPEELSNADLHLAAQVSGGGKLVHRTFPRISAFLKRLRGTTPDPAAAPDLVTAVTSEARRADIPDSRIEEWKTTLPPELVEATDARRFNGRVLSLGLLKPYWWTEALDIDTPHAERRYQSMIILLSEMLKDARERGIDVAVAFLPSPMQYDPSRNNPSHPVALSGMRIRSEWLSGETVAQSRLREWSRREGIAFLDLTETFRAAADDGAPLSYPLDGHWTPRGHAIAGAAIAGWIENESVFPFAR